MKKERRWYCVREIFRGGLTAAFMFGMKENEAVALVGRTETRVPEAIDALLHGEPERKKAVFAINTHTFFLVLRELEHRKVRIPDDLGVCGYDALGWSELVYPGISSIYQPMRQMGVQAGEKIIEALQNGTMSQGTDELEGELTFHHGESADQRQSLFPSGAQHGAGGRCDRGRWRQRMQSLSGRRDHAALRLQKGQRGRRLPARSGRQKRRSSRQL